MEIAGKVALITGASQGIGLATVRLFAAQGAQVALAARSTAKLEQLAAELPGSLVMTVDMRDEAAVREMVAAVQHHFGRLDILVNNAGQGMHTSIEHTDINHYRALLELNVVSVLNAMQAAIPLMRQQGGGVIINISSGTTKMTLPGLGPYASSKHALNALTQIARLELAQDNIRVGLVYPGITATDFMANALDAAPASVARVRMAQADTPESVADKIFEAVQTEAAEVYADSVKRMMERQ
jgi:NAD(P)-dependent dehydrogenase (short-subunit alcohol dehydrogenase family)